MGRAVDGQMISRILLRRHNAAGYTGDLYQRVDGRWVGGRVDRRLGRSMGQW